MSKVESAVSALLSEKATYLNISTVFISFSNLELALKILFYTISIVASVFMIRKTIAETTKIQQQIDKETEDAKTHSVD
jgi:prolipoprotein diacylglyceryltransferase